MSGVVTASNTIQRAVGSLLGCAVVDALGAIVEFCAPGSFKLVDYDAFSRVSEYPNPHGTPAGTFTDDTSMALCMAQSFLEKRKCDPVDQLEKYRAWCSRGYMSPTGKCFDIGNQTYTALMRHQWDEKPLLDIFTGCVGANGGIMRQAPVSIACLGTAADAIHSRARVAVTATRTTHSTPACLQASILINEICYHALQGDSKEALLKPGRFASVFDSPEILSLTGARSLIPSIRDIIDGKYYDKKPKTRSNESGIVNSADVDKTLESALWALYNTSDFASGALQVVNLGNDSDTAGAVYGAIAGCVYGVDGIPKEWIVPLGMRDTVEKLAKDLAELSLGAGIDYSVTL